MSDTKEADAAAAAAADPNAMEKEAIFVASGDVPADAKEVCGYDFDAAVAGGAVDFSAMLASYAVSGFQAANVGNAITEVNRMLAWRGVDDETGESTVRCKIFLGYTSNMISSGLRETLCFLARNSCVDVIVSSAGGVEEDFIKCLAKTYTGDFALKGAELRRQGLNRIGNLIVPNNNYCLFEDWILPILDAMLVEQNRDGVNWTPSKMIQRLGKEIDDESSVYYWCYKNNIPVYCPALTDGSLGDMLYFHSFKNPGLKVDIVEDIRNMNLEAVHAPHSGMLILGGGMIKHHICNANLFRNGADFAVYINTGQEFDGSDSGARPDEAVSWGKIRMDAKPVKVYSDATVVWPLIVAETFFKDVVRRRKQQQQQQQQ